MARLRILSGAKACRILIAHGFDPVRRRGSHIAVHRRDADGKVTVPVPDHRELRSGTLLSIVRQSGYRVLRSRRNRRRDAESSQRRRWPTNPSTVPCIGSTVSLERMSLQLSSSVTLHGKCLVDSL